jgi:threonine aldolase
MFGGGMRQAGVLAAAGLHALDHHVRRLAEDHARARRLAEAIAGMPAYSVDLDSVQTNMAYVTIEGGRPADEVVAALAARGVDVLALGPDILRAVTHLHIADGDIDRAIEAFDAVGRDLEAGG